jgi:hypothetical protein
MTYPLARERHLLHLFSCPRQCLGKQAGRDKKNRGRARWPRFDGRNPTLGQVLYRSGGSLLLHEVYAVLGVVLIVVAFAGIGDYLAVVRTEPPTEILRVVLILIELELCHQCHPLPQSWLVPIKPNGDEFRMNFR